MTLPFRLVGRNLHNHLIIPKGRKDIIIRDVIGICLIALPFVPVGTYFLQQLDKIVIVRSVGILIILVTVLSIMSKDHKRLFNAAGFKWPAGIFGGLLGGAFNMPGPPLILFAYYGPWKLRNAIANLQFMFVVLGVMVLFSFIYSGIINMRIAFSGAVIWPVVILFTLLGTYMGKRISDARLRRVITIFLLGIGVAMLIRP